MVKTTTRRQFLKSSTSISLVAAFGGIKLSAQASQPQSDVKTKINLPPIDKVRIGIIGMGGRGNSLMGNLMNLKDEK